MELKLRKFLFLLSDPSKITALNSCERRFENIRQNIKPLSLYSDPFAAFAVVLLK
jgi:hypothetical protein